MRIVLFILIGFTPLIGKTKSMHRVVGVGMNEVIRVPGIVRAAVGNAKIAKAKAIAPNEVLITGKKPGTTLVRIWREGERLTSYEIKVVPVEAYENYRGKDRSKVVNVSVEFLELSRALSKNFGIRWPQTIPFSGASSVHGSSRSTGLNYSVSFGSARGWLEALVRQGWAKILARPDLYVRLGEEATFHSGGEFPVFTSRENYGQFHQHVAWKPYGLTVKVKPYSADGLHIHSDIEVQISEMDQSGGTEGVPSLTKRELNTKINSKDRQTVILSGLIRQVKSERKAGLPLLGAIPLLGPLLFSSTSERSNENEILMAVTFSLVSSRGDERRIRLVKERFHSGLE